jgi:hypothetical protein
MIDDQKLYYIQYEVQPLPDNDQFSTAGGAYVNCYLMSASSERATSLAHANFTENSWEIVSVEDGPRMISSEHFVDAETRECVDKAASEGECYVYHLWPIDPQEDDLIH